MSLDLKLPEVVKPDFAFRALLDPAGLQFRLTGSADARATPELEVFMKQLHAEAQRLAVPEVMVDLTGCTFMNSSCFKAFLSWIAAITDLSPDVQYRIRFAWISSSYWQRRGLQALKAYADNLVQM